MKEANDDNSGNNRGNNNGSNNGNKTTIIIMAIESITPATTLAITALAKFKIYVSHN
ncbi:3092_t:CDS:2 [Funneliformis geosporum]|nr:3092_t:CDS:2 [Funneliformis geosporum]